METNDVYIETIFEGKIFTEEQLCEMDIKYTNQTFSKYLIYKRDNTYYLMDKLNNNQFRIHLYFIV